MKSQKRIVRSSSHSFANRMQRQVWNITYWLLFRPSPKVAHFWRRWLLKIFGASIGARVVVHPSVIIWAPWNLVLKEGACLGPNVDCYSVGAVEVGRNAVISQYSYLCGATHDYETVRMPLVVAPIMIGDNAWVCADVFVGPGVVIGEGAVVGARSTVTRDVPSWMVVAGNPVRTLRERQLRPE